MMHYVNVEVDLDEGREPVVNGAEPAVESHGHRPSPPVGREMTMSHYEQHALELYDEPIIEDYLPNDGESMSASERFYARESYRVDHEQWKERVL